MTDSVEVRYFNWLLSKATLNRECLECHYSTATHGYCKVSGNELAHRYVYRMHKGPIPNGLWVLHKCDNRGCINIDHLFLGTQEDNDKDRDNKGRCSNEGRPRVVSEAQVLEMANLREQGWTYQSIGDKYFVNRETVRNALGVGSYAHISR